MNEELFDNVIRALEVYKTAESEDMDVPPEFQVPLERPWPKELWGLKLGQHVQSIRERGPLIANHDEREQRLLDIGNDGGIRTNGDRIYSMVP